MCMYRFHYKTCNFVRNLYWLEMTNSCVCRRMEGRWTRANSIPPHSYTYVYMWDPVATLAHFHTLDVDQTLYLYTHTQTYMYTYIYLHMYTYIRAHTHIFVSIYRHIHFCVYVHKFSHIKRWLDIMHAHTHTHTHTRIYVSMYVYIPRKYNMCIYIHVSFTYIYLRSRRNTRSLQHARCIHV